MAPRAARSELSTYTYFHICSRGSGGQNIFFDEKDHVRYLSLLEKYRQRNRLQYFAYCLMTNHIHLLLLAPSIVALSKAIHMLSTSHTQCISTAVTNEEATYSKIALAVG
jgi:putative transposase